MARVLLVDDEAEFTAPALEVLRGAGHEVDRAETLQAARDLLRANRPQVLLLDLMLPDGNGLELLEELGSGNLQRVVLITGHPGIKALISDLSGPSVSYATKPIDVPHLLELARDFDDESPVQGRRSEEVGLHFGLLVGESPRMLEIYEQVARVAPAKSPVLVVGETGTGKELIARAIHGASGLRGEFVAMNCGSLSRELAGSELFGHEKGSFTGAIRNRRGFFRRADSGTLFLDEFTEMPIELQPHFLRALETGQVLPVGGEKEETVDVRIVAATNREPTQAVEEKMLRKDLFFRLSVFPIVLPPLRERLADIPLLVDHFLARINRREGDSRRFSAGSMQRLVDYQWPGNVRELLHVVQRATIMTDPKCAELELPGRFESPFGRRADTAQGVEVGRSIKDVERELIMCTLAHFEGDKKATAETLGISLNTLYNRLNAYEA
jgi:two-component system response regulator HydG